MWATGRSEEAEGYRKVYELRGREGRGRCAYEGIEDVFGSRRNLSFLVFVGGSDREVYWVVEEK